MYDLTMFPNPISPQKDQSAMAGLWLAIRRQPSGFWVVFALATMVESLWLAFVNVGFLMDSVGYWHFANILAGIELKHDLNELLGRDFDATVVARSTAGYPLILLLAGAVVTGSFSGIVLVQAIMAIAMPLLAYKTLDIDGDSHHEGHSTIGLPLIYHSSERYISPRSHWPWNFD
jgi:hypothetical protein